MVDGTPAGYLHEAVRDHAEHMQLGEQAKRRGDETEQWRHRALATWCLLAAAEQYLDDSAEPDPAVLRTLFSSRLSFQASEPNARGWEAIHVV